MVKQKYDSEIVANRIKEEMKQRNWTYQKLAEKAGISVDSIKSYGSGRRIPDSYNLNAISKALRVSPFYLLGETDFRSIGEKWDKENPERTSRVRLETDFIDSAEALGFYHQDSEDPAKDYEDYIAYNKMYQERKKNMKTRSDVSVVIGSAENRIIENFVTGEITIQAVSEEDVERGFQHLIQIGIIVDQ